MNTSVDPWKAEETTELVGGIATLMQMGAIKGEEAADALLAAEGALDRACATYTARQLARRMRLDRERAPSIETDGVPQEMIDYVVSRRLNELVSLAGLKPMEEICLRMFVAGTSPKLMGAILRIGQRRARMHLRIARRKTAQVYDEGPYAGWLEVYLSEVRRGRQSP